MKPARLSGENLQRSIKMYLTAHHHFGKQHEASKEVLGMEFLGRTDEYAERVIRDAVSALQLSGEPIVSNTDTGGYYYPETEEEFLEYMADNQKRIDALTAKRAAMYQGWHRRTKRVISPLQERLI